MIYLTFDFAADSIQDFFSTDLEKDSTSSSDEEEEEDDEQPLTKEDNRRNIYQPCPSPSGDPPGYNRYNNEQHLSRNESESLRQRPVNPLPPSPNSNVNNPNPTMPPTTFMEQSRRRRVPYTEVNKTAFVDHFMNKQYKTRNELPPDTAVSQQDVQSPPMWKQEIDDLEELPPQRKKVVYGEKRHLRAFIPVLVESQKQNAIVEEEEGVIFSMVRKFFSLNWLNLLRETVVISM